MKTKLILLIIILLLSNAVYAEDKSFYGSVDVGTGYITGKLSKDTVTKDTKHINSLGKEEDSENITFPYLGLELGYKRGGYDLKLKLEGKDEILLSFNKDIHKLGTIIAEFGYFKDDVWKNPFYNLSANNPDHKRKREKTIIEETAITFGLANIYDTGIYLTSTFGQGDIKNEKISYKDLKRDYEFAELETGLELLLNKTSMIKPYLAVAQYNAKGAAEDKNRYKLGLEYSKEYKKFEFFTDLNYAVSKHKESSSFFNEKRNDNEIEFIQIISYKKLFNIKNTEVFATYRFNKRDSSVNFYDSDSNAIILGTSYNF